MVLRGKCKRFYDLVSWLNLRDYFKVPKVIKITVMVTGKSLFMITRFNYA